MNKMFLLAIAVSFPLSLGACSSSNTSPLNTGERISQRGGDIGEYGESWSAGQKDVARGAKSIEKSAKNLADGEKDLARAREQVAKAEQQINAARADRANGEKLIEDGTGRMQRAEAAYSAIRSGPSAVAQDDQNGRP